MTSAVQTQNASDSCVIYSGANDLLDRVERDGFFVLPGFFDRQAVIDARAEVERLLEQKEQFHLHMKATDPTNRAATIDASTPYKSSYEDNLHTQFFFSSRSKAYCRLLNDLFHSETIQTFIKGLAGSMRLRVDLCQRAKGYDDSTGQAFEGPLAWHRDTPGEFTFGIFLDDNPNPGWGGTLFIPGSHWNPLNPRWDLITGEKGNFTRLNYYAHHTMRHLPDHYVKCAPLNRAVRKKLTPQMVEATGMMGDIYFFLNDTWHGRAANRTGRRNIASRFGGFATDFKFKDDVPLPKATADLPEPLRSLYLGPWVPNENPNTLLRRIQTKTHQSLTYWAAQEKKLLVNTFRTIRI